MIAQSTDRVNAGSVLVGDAGQIIAEIVGSVQRVTDIVGEISSASQEQSTGTEQVNTVVTQMDEVTQQNAALVEEASAAAHTLAEQANSLRDAVAVFAARQRTTVWWNVHAVADASARRTVQGDQSGVATRARSWLGRVDELADRVALKPVRIRRG